MSAVMKAIHVGRKALGLDEDDYRALLVRVTGKDSLRAMNERERQAVVQDMRAHGFSPQAVSTSHRVSTSLDMNGGKIGLGRRLEGPFAGKMLALWLSAYELGVVRKRSADALVAFVERQTGIAHLNWVREGRDANRAIEALKAMIARSVENGGGGVEWPKEQSPRAAKVAVIAAQHRKLGLGETYIDNPEFDLKQLDAIIAGLGAQIRAQASTPHELPA